MKRLNFQMRGTFWVFKHLTCGFLQMIGNLFSLLINLVISCCHRNFWLKSAKPLSCLKIANSELWISWSFTTQIRYHMASKRWKMTNYWPKMCFQRKLFKKNPKKAFFGLFRHFRPQIAINCADINGKQWKTIYK